jgi:hypothetical protein
MSLFLEVCADARSSLGSRRQRDRYASTRATGLAQNSEREICYTPSFHWRWGPGRTATGKRPISSAEARFRFDHPQKRNQASSLHRGAPPTNKPFPLVG